MQSELPIMRNTTRTVWLVIAPDCAVGVWCEDEQLALSMMAGEGTSAFPVDVPAALFFGAVIPGSRQRQFNPDAEKAEHDIEF